MGLPNLQWGYSVCSGVMDVCPCQLILIMCSSCVHQIWFCKHATISLMSVHCDMLFNMQNQSHTANVQLDSQMLYANFV